MRLTRPILFAISAVCLVSSFFLWRLGDELLERRDRELEAPAVEGGQAGSEPGDSASVERGGVNGNGASTNSNAFDLVSTESIDQAQESAQDAQTSNGSSESQSESDERENPKPYRLSNSSLSLDDIIQSESGIILENATIDTDHEYQLEIPDHLQARGPVGAYIVQFDHRLSQADYDMIRESRGEIISYIPNNALLVQGDAQNIESLGAGNEVKAVIPWEPYFKLKESLLESAVKKEPLNPGQWLHIVGFPGGEESLVDLVSESGGQLLYRESTPFGPSIVIDPADADWVSLASHTGVMAIEPISRRSVMNDVARPRLGVAPDSLSSTNYLGLTGKDIPVNVNDTGVDASHPDLAGRVFPGDPADPGTTQDIDGHGTHVAGSIASSGENSPGPDEDGNPAALGSDPDANFRGMAPEAHIYALPIDLNIGPTKSDRYLIDRAAEINYLTLSRTNPIISNNSWGYVGLSEYSSGSANYDAAVRDALNEMPGDQPIVYIFAAGNEGNGSANGQGGTFDSIRSPGNAKNVITVGAIENFRNITNNFTVGPEESAVDLIEPFLEDTDTDNQVAAFSSRGNTGVGTEGFAGRFKPDIVAPGTYVVSTRSGSYLDPTVSTDVEVTWLQDQRFVSAGLTHFTFRIPGNAQDVRIEIMNGNTPLDPNDLSFPIYASYGGLSTTNDKVGDNFFMMPDDFELQVGNTLNYAVGNETGDDQTYSIRIITTVLIPGGGTIQDATAQLNAPLAPHYLYLSGTSMATPVVTGIVTLISEYLEKNDYSQSAALLKALVINGARTVNNIYSFDTKPLINYQGWGVVNLTNTLPATTFSDTASPVQFIDQSIDNALSTGEEISWDLTISDEAIEAESDLKITLVWTDPPGNPSAGVKLVNDLDLVLTNHNSTNSFIGNDFPIDSDYVLPKIDTSAADTINNVENIFIRGPLSTNYTISVKGSRVNVNAVRGHQNKIAQDFALVVSTTDTGVTNAVKVTPVPALTTEINDPTTITNGLALLYQRTSAHSPLLGGANGQTNQWKFYTFTNTFLDIENPVLTNGPNVAFTTFLAPNLSNPKRNLSADVDLYVTRGDAGLLTLNPTSLANAQKSVNEGGTESIVYTDASIGEVFYIGVKAEDQKGAEFSIIGISSDQPFSSIDEDGNHRYPGFPVGNLIPDGNPIVPGYEPIIVPGGQNILIQNARVEVSYYSENFGDILGNLSHNNQFVVLNNHSENFGLPHINGVAGLFDSFVYDDSNSGSLVTTDAVTSDGPGDLTQFIGESASGPWIFSLFDNAQNNQTRVDSFEIVVEELLDITSGIVDGSVLPQRFEYFAVEVPGTANLLEVFLSNIQPNLPLDLYIRREFVPTLQDFDKSVSIIPPGGSLTLSPQDSPPLNGGRYFVGVFNPNTETVSFSLEAIISENADGVESSVFALGLGPDEGIPINDHAEVRSSLLVDSDERIAEIRAGVRVDHPRVSDLSFRLVSPQGDSFLLSESRGGVDANKLGVSLGDPVNGFTNHSYTVFTIETNLVAEPLKFTSPPFHLDPVGLTATNRVLALEDFQSLTNGVYPRGTEIGRFTSTLTAVQVVGDDDDRRLQLGTDRGQSGGIAATFKTASGRDYIISLLYENENNGLGGLQIYTNRVLATFDSYTKNTREPERFVTIPIKARSAETTFELRSSLRGNRAQLKEIQIDEVGVLPDNYVRPEESLDSMEGKRALGEWDLVISDDRAGGTGTESILRDWKMEFVFANPDVNAVTLTNGVIFSGVLTNGTRAFFKVPVPRNATIATNILDGEGDLVLLGDRAGVPLGPLPTLPNNIDYYVDFLGPDFGELIIISTNQPVVAPLEPGNQYYLAVDNADSTDNRDLNFQIRVTFDADDPIDTSSIPELISGTTISTNIPAGPEMKYWRFNVDDEEIRSLVEAIPQNENLDLFVSRGTLPTFSVFEVASRSVGTDPDVLSLELDPDPLRLDQGTIVPGTWFVGIVNRSPDTDITFDLTYTEELADITDLVDSVVTDGGSVPPGEVSYFRFNAPGATRSLLFETVDASGDLELVAVRGAPVPSFSRFDFIGVDVDGNKVIELDESYDGTFPGDWYIGVYNFDPANPVTFNIRVSSQLATITGLQNKIPHLDTLGWEGFGTSPIKYFKYDVSSIAESLVIDLENLGGPDNLDLIVVNSLENGLPSDSNFSFKTSSPGQSPDRIVIRPTSLPSPLSTGTWYIAVAHRGTDNLAPPVDFQLTVTEVVTEVADLHVNEPITVEGLVSGFEDYYKFVIAEETIAFRLDVRNVTGDVDLYLRKDGLPSLKTFDTSSVNRSSRSEVIHVSDRAGLLTLEPGEYFAMVRNVGTTPSNYTIGFEELVSSFSEIPADVFTRGNVRFLGQEVNFIHKSPTNAVEVIFRTPQFGDDFDLFVSRNDRFPSLTVNEFESTVTGFRREFISVSSDQGLETGVETEWFITLHQKDFLPDNSYNFVVNPVVGLDYDKPTETQTVQAGTTRYYRIPRSLDAEVILINMRKLTGNLSLRAHNNFGLNGAPGFGRRSENAGLEDELIQYPNTNQSSDFLYIAAINNTGQAIDFELEINIELPEIIDLVDGVPVNGIIEVGRRIQDVDYYRAIVPENATKMTVSLYDMEFNGTLVARKGRNPFPNSLSLFDYRSANGGRDDEEIIITRDSDPVPLSAGEWYFSVEGQISNGATTNRDYTIRLDYELTDPGGIAEIITPGITVVNGDICLNWMAEIGATYRIEGLDSLNSETWTSIKTLVADTETEQYCLTENDLNFVLFRVVKLVPVGGQPDTPINVSGISINENGEVCLTWETSVGKSYQIQRMPSLVAAWESFGGLIPGTGNPITTCIPVAEDQLQFFRVLESSGGGVVIPRQELEGVSLEIKDTEICLTWEPETGLKYDIEVSTDFGATWTVTAVDVPVTLGTTAEYCHPISEDVFELVRVVKYGTGTVTGPPQEVSSVSVGLKDGDICLNWEPAAGLKYDVEVSSDFGATWTTLSADVAVTVGQTAEYCHTPSADKFELLRVMQYSVGGQPTPPEEVEAATAQFKGGQICLNWNAELGFNYDIEVSSDFGATWTSLASNVPATPGQSAEYCHTPASDKLELIRVMRYRPGGRVESPIPAGTEIGGISLSSEAGGQFKLSWEGTANVSYRVEGLKQVNGTWETVTTPIQGADKEILSADLDPASGYLFFRVIVN